ncbi:MAG: hypothetical protein KBF73_05570 [Flavobacteriales bacterium]|nr:hypothetical protein [Flavobacteriales bacterium]
MNTRIAYIIALAVVVLLLWQCGDSATQQQQAGTITPLQNSWDIAVPHQEIPEGLTSLSAASCGACHQEHYKEWQTSTHAHAWTDLQFQSELKKESSPFMCINCHIPLQNQQEFIIKGLIDGDIYKPVKEKNPHFDRALQQEGINCASCHVREGAVMGPTGTEKAPHRTVKNMEHLSEKLCISCHNANAVITPTLACSFETGDEWKAGPYFGNQNCISCHMPETHREIVPGYGERKSRFHNFPGSGIPKLKGAETGILNGFAFYPQEITTKYKVGERVEYTFKVKNEHAGHRVPTGDPERFFIIRFELRNTLDSLVVEQEYRIGEEWEWHPQAKKLSDNNLNPGEERSFPFSTEMKEKGSYTLSLTVTKHRMNEETAIYNKLGDDYPLFITVFEKKYMLSVR